MAFLGGGDASCSTAANPLSQFSKHVQDDKSLQRDRLVGRGSGPAVSGFRSAPRRDNSGEVRKHMNWRVQAQNRQSDYTDSFRAQMMDDFMQHPTHMPHAPVGAPPLVMDQMRRDFESVQASTARGSQHATPSNWAAEFDPGISEQATFAPNPGGFDPSEFERYAHAKQASLSGRLDSPAINMTNTGYQRPMGSMNMGYNSMYSGMGGLGMQRPYGSMGLQQPLNQQQNLGTQRKGKGRLVELDDRDWEAQFAELETPQVQTNDLDAEASRAMEAELSDMDRSVPSTNDRIFGDFESVWQKIKAETPGLRDFARTGQTGEFAEWEDFDMNTVNTHLPRDPELGNYTFEPENIFNAVNNPFEEGVRIMDGGGNLSLAALAFEAAVIKDKSHAEAWTRLGAVQAQNEKETPAIRALEQAVKLDPQNLDALMGLAVSYTNEGYDTTAYRTLERWLSTKYPTLVPLPDTTDPLAQDLGFTDRQQLHERVTKLFISAAQQSPDPATMDADVQVGLGVLFYGAEEYEKAVDCFSAALESSESASLSHPQSINQRPLLWNRLGATLANSGRSEEAISAYEKALELNPNFVRARYNLGVSCINIGCHAEAAQHLLGALNMHKHVEHEGREKAREIVEGGGGGGGLGTDGDETLERMIRANQSTNLYDTLRRVFTAMERRDLVDRVGIDMDPASFRGEFDF